MSHFSSLTLWSSIKVPRALSVSLQKKRSIPLVEVEDKFDSNSSLYNLKWKKDMLSLPGREKNSATTLRSFECVEPYNKVRDSYAPLEYFNNPLNQPSTSQKSPKRRKKKISFVTIPEIYVIDDNSEEDWREKGFRKTDPFSLGRNVVNDFGVQRGGGSSKPFDAGHRTSLLASVAELEDYFDQYRKDYNSSEDMYEEDKEKFVWNDWNPEENYIRRKKFDDELDEETLSIKTWKIDELEQINLKYKRLENKIKKATQKKIRKNKYKVSKPLKKISPTTKNKYNKNLRKPIAEIDSDIDSNEVFYDCEMVNSNIEVTEENKKEKETKKVVPADENYYESKLAQLYKIKLGIQT